MPKPINKQELLETSLAEYASLEKFISGLSANQMVLPGVLGEWSVKDVLAHLLEWQQMFFGWYQAGLQGENPPIPSAEYTWRQTPALNQAIYEKHCQRPIEQVLAEFRLSHQKTIQLVESLNEEELFGRGRFAWMRQHNLATYINANTGSHYQWAFTNMRRGLKKLQERHP